ncbi:helix-turn-helix transcriptional regulator [Muricauda ruestringensis]|uniref:Helix-turn-helix transcriptional regulator n=1 Tax=Flagellimonas aurea TaxID=2915619 RepID=A0ABS3G1J0_9FLAO|nr:helix-turn-helix transcriptional regulator [Allomuricauda aurea]MAO18957.1 transcriptional regulator [Allomuricauda sp.]MBO0353272.1 helix-turn-helix transcriptional regulator [Allomuricauda aurea]|tara:strand:- start:668 stop:1021 length:354 start_codon:yes stop_codon:yes gene_type:complete
MKTFSIKISKLDYEIINQVRKLREKKGVSQRDLSELMNLSKSFVGKVEALGQPDKYSIRHLALIAKALKLKSLYELLPKSIPDEDIIEIVYTKVPKINKDGSESKQLEERIIEIWSI